MLSRKYGSRASVQLYTFLSHPHHLYQHHTHTHPQVTHSKLALFDLDLVSSMALGVPVSAAPHGSGNTSLLPRCSPMTSMVPEVAFPLRLELKIPRLHSELQPLVIVAEGRKEAAFPALVCPGKLFVVPLSACSFSHTVSSIISTAVFFSLSVGKGFFIQAKNMNPFHLIQDRNTHDTGKLFESSSPISGSKQVHKGRRRRGGGL